MALYDLRKLALPANSPARQDAEEHLAALDKWVTDIAYLPTAADGDYLAMVIDLFSHKVAGRSLSTPLATGLVCEALRRAVEP